MTRDAFVPGRSRFEAGDALRAVAPLSVFLYHATFVPLATGHLYLFFVLSGYLVLRPFVGAAIQGRDRLTYKTHNTRRLIRICIPLWVAFGLIYLRHSIAPNPTGLNVVDGAETDEHITVAP